MRAPLAHCDALTLQKIHERPHAAGKSARLRFEPADRGVLAAEAQCGIAIATWDFQVRLEIFQQRFELLVFDIIQQSGTLEPVGCMKHTEFAPRIAVDAKRGKSYKHFLPRIRA